MYNTCSCIRSVSCKFSEKFMTQTESTPVDGHNIGGVSLASFLQMLEQERKNCTLRVASGKVSGIFFRGRQSY